MRLYYYIYRFTYLLILISLCRMRSIQNSHLSNHRRLDVNIEVPLPRFLNFKSGLKSSIREKKSSGSLGKLPRNYVHSLRASSLGVLGGKREREKERGKESLHGCLRILNSAPKIPAASGCPSCQNFGQSAQTGNELHVNKQCNSREKI